MSYFNHEVSKLNDIFKYSFISIHTWLLTLVNKKSLQGCELSLSVLQWLCFFLTTAAIPINMQFSVPQINNRVDVMLFVCKYVLLCFSWFQKSWFYLKKVVLLWRTHAEMLEPICNRIQSFLICSLSSFCHMFSCGIRFFHHNKTQAFSLLYFGIRLVPFVVHWNQMFMSVQSSFCPNPWNSVSFWIFCLVWWCSLSAVFFVDNEAFLS